MFNPCCPSDLLLHVIEMELFISHPRKTVDVPWAAAVCPFRPTRLLSLASWCKVSLLVALQEEWGYFYPFIREPFENRMPLMFHRVKQFRTAQSALFLSWLSRCPWIRRFSKYLMWNSRGLVCVFLLDQLHPYYLLRHIYAFRFIKLHYLNLVLLSASTNIYWAPTVLWHCIMH